MFGIGPWEFVVILVIALLVVGPKRLPELMRDLGKILAQVRNATDDLRRELKLDEELDHIQTTVRELQDVSATAMQKLMKEVEEETQAPAAPAAAPPESAPPPALTEADPETSVRPVSNNPGSPELPKHDGKA
jgi:Tat protein translocase TatB subunit